MKFLLLFFKIFRILIQNIGEEIIKPLIWEKNPLQWEDEFEFEQTNKLSPKELFDKSTIFDPENWRTGGIYHCKKCIKEHKEILEDLRKNNLKPSNFFLEDYSDLYIKRCATHKETDDFSTTVELWFFKLLNWYRWQLPTIKEIKYRIINGFWKHEVYNFDLELARWAYPRLKKLEKQGVGIEIKNNTIEESAIEQDLIINKILWALWFVNYEYNDYCDKSEWDKQKEYIKLLGEYYSILSD